VKAFQTFGINGFVLDCDFIFKYKYITQEIRDKYVLCTYGKDNNTEDGVKKQLEFGVRGICTDKVSSISKVIYS